MSSQVNIVSFFSKKIVTKHVSLPQISLLKSVNFSAFFSFSNSPCGRFDRMLAVAAAADAAVTLGAYQDKLAG